MAALGVDHVQDLISGRKAAIMLHLIPVAVFLMNPLGMSSWDQRIIFSALLVTVIWWGTRLVDCNKASMFLLAVFLLFGRSTPYQVFKFAFSPIFHLIILSLFLAQGMIPVRKPGPNPASFSKMDCNQHNFHLMGPTTANLQ